MVNSIDDLHKNDRGWGKRYRELHQLECNIVDAFTILSARHTGRLEGDNITIEVPKSRLTYKNAKGDWYGSVARWIRENGKEWGVFIKEV